MKNPRWQAWLTRPDGLATALRAARRDQSMQKLATKLGGTWTSSKVSKIETGQQMPTAAEVADWAKATDTPAEVLNHWQQLHEEAARMRSTFWRRGGGSREETAGTGTHLEATAALTRVVQPGTIPELLQTEPYTRALWEGTRDVDLEQLVADLKVRQETLRAVDRKFEFLIGEAALRTIRGDSAVMAEQLDRLVSASALSNVDIGIIPLMTPLTAGPVDFAFALYDDQAVSSDGVDGYLHTGTKAMFFQVKANTVSGEAVKGRDARRLILAAIDDLPTS